MVTKATKRKLVLAAVIVTGSYVLYHRLSSAERARFKRSLKYNSVLFLLNLIPYGVQMMRRPEDEDEVPGPTPYATVET